MAVTVRGIGATRADIAKVRRAAKLTAAQWKQRHMPRKPSGLRRPSRRVCKVKAIKDVEPLALGDIVIPSPDGPLR